MVTLAMESLIQETEEKLGFSTKPLKIKIGKVSTPYHAMELKIQTTVEGFNEDSQIEVATNERCALHYNLFSFVQAQEHEVVRGRPIIRRRCITRK